MPHQITIYQHNFLTTYFRVDECGKNIEVAFDVAFQSKLVAIKSLKLYLTLPLVDSYGFITYIKGQFARIYFFFISADFNEIWLFVEQEMKMKIPSHIKHILKYCGFENCHTISTIEENDIEYFENEVRKGEITIVLNETTSENFEFSRGHKKLIMAITKLVNEKLNERGVDGFSMPKQRKRTLSNATTVATKISKLSTNENSSLDCFSEAPEPLETLQEYKSAVLRKMILSLITHTPEMFANVSIRLQ